jgi:8-oxo-dGTP pyrophosphatase MutT (NUDIX family)
MLAATDRQSLEGKRFAQQAGVAMTTTIDRTALTRHVQVDDPDAAVATVVVPAVFVAVRWWGGRLLLVRRTDSGCWEFPGGLVEVGENAEDAAVRATAEEAGVTVLITGLVGLFTDPAHIVPSVDGEVRQQFDVLFRARAVGGEPHGDAHETSEAAWVAVADLRGLRIEPHARTWITEALSCDSFPHLG